MLEIVICEDNTKYLDLLNGYVIKALHEAGVPGSIVCKTAKPKQVLEYLDAKSANVLFLDIDLCDSINGIDLALMIREKVNRPYIVYITEHLECVFTAFKTRPFDFLPKPAAYNIVKNCIKEIYKDYIKLSKQGDESNTITVKAGAVVYSIKKDNIVFIEKLQNKAIIHGVDKIITCYETLEYFESLFAEDSRLIRCHKSFIVNKNHISEIRMNKLEILFETGHVCYIGKKYKEALLSG